MLVNGSDGLAHLPLDASAFGDNLTTTDNSLQSIANALDETLFRRRGIITSDANSGPGIYQLQYSGTFTLPSPTGSGAVFLLHAPAGGSNAVTVASASGTVSGDTSISRDGQVLLALDHGVGTWQVRELSAVPVPGFRGSWASGEVYSVGDQAITPTGALVSATTAHTAGAQYNAAESAQWAIVTGPFVRLPFVANGYYYTRQTTVSPIGNIIETVSDHEAQATLDAVEGAQWLVLTLRVRPAFALAPVTYISGELVREGGQTYVATSSFVSQGGTLAAHIANFLPVCLDRLKDLDFLAGTAGVAAVGTGVSLRVLASDNSTTALELRDTDASVTVEHRFPWSGTFVLGDVVQVRWVLEQDLTQAQHVVSIGLADNVDDATILVEIGSAGDPELLTLSGANAAQTWAAVSRVYLRGSIKIIEVDLLVEWVAASSAPVQLRCAPAFNLDGTSTANAASEAKCVLRAVRVGAPEEFLNEPLRRLSQAETLLLPGSYDLDSSGGSFTLTLSNVVGVWHFHNSNFSFNTHAVTLGTVGNTFSDGTGAQVTGPIVLDVGGKPVSVLHEARGNDYRISLDSTSGDTSVDEPAFETLYYNTTAVTGPLTNALGPYADLNALLAAGFETLRFQAGSTHGAATINQDWRTTEVAIADIKVDDRPLVSDTTGAFMLITTSGDPVSGFNFESTGFYDSTSTVRITALKAQNTVIPNTALVASDQSASNYLDLGNVRQMWGENTESSTTRTIAFPAAFANTSYSLCVTARVSGTADLTSQDVFMESGGLRTTTSTSGELQRTVAGSNAISQSPEGFTWVAIGLKP